MSNAATVGDIYEAFGRGDIPAILDTLHEDVRWEHWPDGNGAQDAGVPWLAARTGRDEVPGFFEALGGMEFHDFRPLAILEGDDGLVLGLIALEATVNATGARIADREVHEWRFDADGRVIEFRHIVDTAKHAAAAGVTAGV